MVQNFIHPLTLGAGTFSPRGPRTQIPKTWPPKVVLYMHSDAQLSVAICKEAKLSGVRGEVLEAAKANPEAF